MYGKSSIFKLILLMVLFGLLIIIPIEIFTRYTVIKQPAQEVTIQNNSYPDPGTAVSAMGTTTETPVIWEVQVLRDYEEALKKDDLSPEMRSSIETKIAIYSRIATEIETSRHITRTPEPVVTRRFIPTATFYVGLREGGTSDFHAWEAVIQNVWSQYANNNEHITVYAGELGSGTKYPGRGVVYVLRLPAAAIRGASWNEYLLPEETGWVRISGVKGDVLVLTSKEGQTFYFNLPAQQFVTTIKDVVATVTPLPTIGPPPTPPSPYPY